MLLKFLNNYFSILHIVFKSMKQTIYMSKDGIDCLSIGPQKEKKKDMEGEEKDTKNNC